MIAHLETPRVAHIVADLDDPCEAVLAAALAHRLRLGRREEPEHDSLARLIWRRLRALPALS